jgi:hypothetical protein
MQYAQSGDPVPGTDGRLHPQLTCYTCHKKGHTSPFCPTRQTSGVQHQAQGMEITTTNLSNGNSNEDNTTVTGITQHIHAVEVADTDSDDNSVIVSFQFGQQGGQNLEACNDNSILIDTGSTCSVFKNPKMLLNIRRSNKTLRVYTNGGHQDSTAIADLLGFFQVWFNPASMVNILSWADVRKRF